MKSKMIVTFTEEVNEDEEKYIKKCMQDESKMEELKKAIHRIFSKIHPMEMDQIEVELKTEE